MTTPAEERPLPQPQDRPISSVDTVGDDALASVRTAAGRWLPRVSVLEFVSVLILLGNLATVHLEAITKGLGPIHGFLYLCTIACALLAKVRWPAKILAVLPVIGGLLATVYAARRPAADAQG